MPLCRAFIFTSAFIVIAACAAPEPDALRAAEAGPGPVVKFDVFHTPLPDVPLPNDFASRFDALSPTKKRVNASIEVAPTKWEKATRAELDALSGWGTLAPITMQFTEPLDLANIVARHHGDLLDFTNDAVLVIDITASSNERCNAVPLDLGQGNYPTELPVLDLYSSDPRKSLTQLQFDDVDEDVNHNDQLDPGEDTDGDGVLDRPNTLDGQRGSAFVDFYERETNTLIMKPMMPMREATTYAVVLTKRLTSPSGQPVRSPFTGINHAAQTKALGALPECLSRYGLTLDDVGFTWSFTTQSITDDFKRVRDGLYGLGPLANLSTDYPAEISKLFDVRPRGGTDPNISIISTAEVQRLLQAIAQATGGSSAEAQALLDTQRQVDFHVLGEVTSPQFFPRVDESGNALPFYKQVWNLEVSPRPEAVQFWLTVPKNRLGPTPVAIFVHGHGGSTYAGLAVSGTLARYGVATLSVNAPSHGVGLDPVTLLLVKAVFEQNKLKGFGDAILTGRSLDLNGDGTLDPGADYWTSYVLHTRDMVRQTVVDIMQVVRVIGTFDGTTRWKYDVNRDGQPELAGDFNGDGVLEIGGGQPIQLIGGSLGGIIAGVGAGVEPRIESGVAIVPGGMLGEIGPRSALGGVRNAMVLRLLAPLFTTENGVLTITAPEAEGYEANVKVHALPALKPNDTVVAIDLKTREHRCGLVQAEGRFRVAVPSDQGDPLEFRAYAGTLPPQAREGCVLPGADVEPLATVKTFDRSAQFGAKKFAVGDPLVAFTDGFGLRRNSPDIRRLLNLAQVGLESADPMNWAPYWQGHRTLTYGTGETVATRMLLMPSVGDTGVPIASGIALSRAAGFIKYDQVDPRYGKSQNQLLIDSWAVEGLSRTARYRTTGGAPAMLDLEHLSSLTGADDQWGVPRLNPPLRLPAYSAEAGGITGTMFILLSPQGEHGFAVPDPSKPFDLGTLLMNQLGRYVATSGTAFSFDACQVDSTCGWIPPALP